LLERREDDGDVVEPYYYTPTIPMLLVNGAVGIGTGWSCACPSFDPAVVLEGARLWMRSETQSDRKVFEAFVDTMIPWYRDFKGTIQKTGPNKFETIGVYKKTTSGCIHITELPVGVWTAPFVQWLGEKEIQYINRSTPCAVDITLSGNIPSDLDKKMKTKISLDNITVFDQHDVIKKANIVSIFDMWGTAKLSIIKKRKQTKLKQLATEKRVAAIKHAFIAAVKSKELILTEDLPHIIAKLNNITTNQNEHKLLLDMNIRSLTSEKAKELQAKIKELDAKIVELESKTEKQLWEEDAQRFENTTKNL
jgi:DNA topoisomerase-2